jgi:hypothetical protein
MIEEIPEVDLVMAIPAGKTVAEVAVVVEVLSVETAAVIDMAVMAKAEGKVVKRIDLQELLLPTHTWLECSLLFMEEGRHRLLVIKTKLIINK